MASSRSTPWISVALLKFLGLASALRMATQPIARRSQHQLGMDPLTPGNNSMSMMAPDSKRWLHMNPSQGGFGVPWTDGKIQWCFVTGEDQTAEFKAIVRPALAAAWNLWIVNGVDENVLDFREVSTMADCATGDGPRLQVEALDGMSTSIGMHDVGGSMKLNVDETFGLGDRVANFAHEIGHAWGLLHEHQRPDLWKAGTFDEDGYAGATGSKNTFKFNCENLSDYAKMLNRISAAAGSMQAQIVCHSYVLSDEYSFGSAVNFFPYNPSLVFSSTAFDKKSIMLYRSDAGGLVDANGIKATVYTYQDGSFVGGNTQPSAGDIDSLDGLYPGARQASTCFFFMPCSPFQTIFRAMQGCIAGVSCCAT